MLISASKDYKHLYNTRRWQVLRHQQLIKQPLCQISLALGLPLTTADVVDHIKPHKGNLSLFYNADNLQSVSKQMHDSVCQQMEAGTWQAPIGVDGWPVENEYLSKIFDAKRPRSRKAGGWFKS